MSNGKPDERARRAAELLTDPLFCETLDKMKARAVKEWEASANPLDRDYCHAKYKAVCGLARDFMREVETASIAEVRAGEKNGFFHTLFHKLKENF